MKSVKSRLVFLTVIGLMIAMIPAYADLPDLIPKDVLFGNPERTMVEISPDGEKISYVASNEGIMNVWVRTIGKEDDRQVTFDTARGILFYTWAADSKRILYVQDQWGNENYRLYSVNLRNKKIKDYTPFENVRVRVLAWDVSHPRELIIGMNTRNPQIYDAYHLNLRNGKLEMVAENPGNIVNWISDEDFKIRGALAMNPEGGADLLVRDDEDSEWRTLVSWTFDEYPSSYPLQFSNDGNYIYLEDSRNANATRLVRVDVKTGELEVIAEDPQYDLGPVFFHPKTGEVLGVSFIKDKRERVFFDREVEADFEILNQLDEGEVGVADENLDNDMWVVVYNKDDGPVPYYLFDRNTQESTFLFTNKTKLEAYQLASMEPFSFFARDSLEIHGYITFPVGVERSNLPMVVNVHGGPTVRDNWGYNPQAQWFANRGYICLQVNYRGSAGYGKDFLNAGVREWGGKMHTDLIDAVNWTVDKGYADPDRIAIFGGSYGGYAALCGATFTPDVFCCAVDMFGPSNLITMLEAIPPYWKPMQEIMYKRVGHPVDDAEFLKSRSPLFRVDSIRIPMLIAQGANDPRVKQAESDQIVAAMEEKGIDFEYMLFSDEGHGFMKEENRLEFYTSAERFLAKHLDGRYEE